MNGTEQWTLNYAIIAKFITFPSQYIGQLVDWSVCHSHCVSVLDRYRASVDVIYFLKAMTNSFQIFNSEVYFSAKRGGGMKGNV